MCENNNKFTIALSYHSNNKCVKNKYGQNN